MTHAQLKAIRDEVECLLNMRAALPWWAWIRRSILTHELHMLLDSAL